MSDQTAVAEEQANAMPLRESMAVDVVIVGAGPAGLSAAIRLKQLDETLEVVVVEKGSEVGAHILSGNVLDTSGLDKLLPDWREDETAPVKVRVTQDKFLYLGPAGSLRLPSLAMPKLMSNHESYIVSLGNVCRWMAEKAEALGVEIYPGFAAAEVLFEGQNVVGVATGDMGVGRDGKPKDGFERGMELRGKYVLFAEGVRGSCSQDIIARYGLQDGRDHPKYGLGLKELWELDPSKHQEGLVQHTFGWPLDDKTGGGSFIYHLENNQAYVGFVVHLNYENPYISPFDELQRFKTHPDIAPMFEGAKRISYGARAIAEGGYQSMPKPSFPGGLLIGCAAGYVNVPRIKGSHNAMLSGILAAERVSAALKDGRANDELADYEDALLASEVGHDLRTVRNVKPLWSKFGTRLGVALGGIDMWMQERFGRSFFGTMAHGKPDHECLKPAAKFKPIAYPKPDGELTFDKLSSVFISNTNHEEDQPVHLKLKDPDIPVQENWPIYAGPSQRYCPAGVYEFVEENGVLRFQINAQNCVHCKTCDIKDPYRNIVWRVPEGGGGPNYPNM